MELQFYRKQQADTFKLIVFTSLNLVCNQGQDTKKQNKITFPRTERDTEKDDEAIQQKIKQNKGLRFHPTRNKKKAMEEWHHKK